MSDSTQSISGQATLLSSARVLIVDDSRLMRLGLIKALREIGVESVAEAGNGQIGRAHV